MFKVKFKNYELKIFCKVVYVAGFSYLMRHHRTYIRSFVFDILLK